MTQTVRRNYVVPASVDKTLGRLAVIHQTSKSALISKVMGDWCDRELKKAPDLVRSFLEACDRLEAQ